MVVFDSELSSPVPRTFQGNTQTPRDTTTEESRNSNFSNLEDISTEYMNTNTVYAKHIT